MLPKRLCFSFTQMRPNAAARVWFDSAAARRSTRTLYVMIVRSFFISLLVASVAQAAEPGWDDLVLKSNAYMRLQGEKLESEYGLSKHERWDIDQDSGELVFSNGGIPAVVAKFQFVGSVSTTSHTWLWSWANASILPSLSQRIHIVRDYGQKHGFKKVN